MWHTLSIIATVGAIVFGLLTTLCDMHELKEKTSSAK